MDQKESASQVDDYDRIVALRDAIEFVRDKARDLRQSVELK